MALAREEIRNQGRSHEEAKNYREMPMPNIFRRSLPPGAAHLAASLRYHERNIAAGKCRYCPKPLDRNSVDMCTKHLAMKRERERNKRWKKGVRPDPRFDPGTRECLYGQPEIPPSKHGHQPGTLASLAMNREQRTRALLAELGIKPEHAAVSLKAAKEALLRVMPDSKAKAMATADLFEVAGVVTSNTGYKALRELLKAGKIERIGKPGKGNSFRYFASGEGTAE